MEYFPVRYDFRVVIYERKMFIRLATDCVYLSPSYYLPIVCSLMLIFMIILCPPPVQNCLCQCPLSLQCDQMVRSFFNIWPLATTKISPIMSQIMRQKAQHFAKSVKNLPKICKLLPKWLNFAKSGHTVSLSLFLSTHTSLLFYFLCKNTPFYPFRFVF